MIKNYLEKVMVGESLTFDEAYIYYALNYER